MSEYNQMQDEYREKCKERIERQLLYGETHLSAFIDFQQRYCELAKSMSV